MHTEHSYNNLEDSNKIQLHKTELKVQILMNRYTLK